MYKQTRLTLSLSTYLTTQPASTVVSTSLVYTTLSASSFTQTLTLTATATTTATATSISLSLVPASTVVQLTTTTAYITTYPPASTVTTISYVYAQGAASASSSNGYYSQYTTVNNCPQIDQQNITDSNGETYGMYCNSDTSINAFANRAATNSWADCLDICDSVSGCVAFTYGTFRCQ